jgi:hypothetical protein
MSRRGPLTASLALAATLAGCAWLPPLGERVVLQPAGERILVVPRATLADNRAVSENAVELLAAALRDAREALEPRDFLRLAGAAGAGVWAPRLVERVQQGSWPTPEDAGELQARFGIASILAVEVTTYDQVWGRYAKFTRVGVDVQSFRVATGALVWRIYRDVEVEDKRGRAFRYALEQAVLGVADTIDPPSGFSLTAAWRSWRR